MSTMPDSTLADPQEIIAALRRELAERTAERDEALAQQTATTEVLGVINSSPGDLAPVFDAMLEKALRLCDAMLGTLFTYDERLMHPVAMRGASPEYSEFLQRGPQPPGGGALGDFVRGKNLHHIRDLKDTDAYRRGDAHRRALVDLGGARALVGIPLRKDANLLGGMLVYRREPAPFTEKQIALLQNFAVQAVIAIENARLITETGEALEQQTATAEVLGVINSSPGDLAPVFDAVLEKAMRQCGASFGEMRVYEGNERFRTVAIRGVPAAFEEHRRQNAPPSGPNSLGARVLAGERIIHIVDLKDDAAYRQGDANRRSLVDLGGARSALAVALRQDQKILGFITLYRQEVRAYADKQIALLQNFAAQAVIAMENARLLGDLRERTSDLEEALEYQTATSDVLKVISQSDADLTYVLQTALDTAARLCEVGWGHIFLRRGDHLQTMASLGVTAENRADMDANPVGVDAHSASGRAVLTGQVVHIADIAADSQYAHASTRAAGIRTMLGVPLLRDGVPIGSMSLARKVAEPFTERQIELVRTFADQAVIAIENARLLDEIRQRQAELRVTFDNMADGVAMFDGALRLTAWNRNFQELLALSDDFLSKHHTFDKYIRYLTERGEFGETDAEAQIGRLRARLDEHYSFERTRPDGTVVEVRHNPMPDGGFVLIYGDITERKRSEAEISAARDAAEAAYHDLQSAQANLVQVQKMAALGQLTAGIAHEIKNPLNFVNNFASLSNELLEELKDETEPALAALGDDKRAEIDETMAMLTGNLEKIVEHGRRADNIVKSMLEHSRGVSGERREVDINGLVEEALNLAYHGARAHDQNFNITLERDYAPGLQPIELAPQEVTRVFLNLFGNGFYAANKRTHGNGDSSFQPVLMVATREDGDAVEVRVRDNGTGIPPEARDKLFQPFFTTKPTGEGTGLGLSISYDIVTQQHGGTITVESEPGAYTEFTVRLPRR